MSHIEKYQDTHGYWLVHPKPWQGPRSRDLEGNRFHYFGKDSELWRHVTAKKVSDRDRDFQRSKLYAAEQKVVGWRDNLMSMDEMLAFVGDVIDMGTFRSRWGIWTIIVGDGRGLRTARGGNGKIRVGRYNRSKLIVLHELAHAICPSWECHGRLFARTYVELALLTEKRGLIPNGQGSYLRAHFVNDKVKMNARRPKA